MQNDFAAQADWCVKAFNEANHPPAPKVKGDLNRDVKGGDTVKLEATTSDPDGNEIIVECWQYAEA